MTPQAMTDIEEIAETICRVSKKYSKPVLCCFMGIADVSKGERILREGGIPHYRFPEAAARALANMNYYLKWIKRPRTEVRYFKVNREKAQNLISEAKEKKLKFLNEFQATQLLSFYGFPVLKCKLIKDEEELEEVVREIGFPVAIKISSPDIIHKFDVGGVRLNIENEIQLKNSFHKMIEDIKRLKPKAKIEGILIQEMAREGKEVILGLKRDPHFGPVLMFGLGGIYVEAFRDVTFRLAPIRTLSAKRMIESTKAYQILKGMRGDKPSDISSIEECIERLSQLSIELPDIQEIDINPLIVYEKGKGCRVVHARIII
jgi:acyl-CoA synthetase (NDP forming)